MKVAFICGSVDPGHDGVGDYTTSLGKFLSQEGWDCSRLALREPGDKMPVVTNSLLKLPASMSRKERQRIVVNFLTVNTPTWISLQYVGFSFSPRGVPLELISLLRKRGAGTKLHIFFHELWCGMDSSAPLKERVLGIVQKYFLWLLVKLTKPESVFTSIKPYQKKLLALGIEAECVPVFGTNHFESFRNTNQLSNFQAWRNVIKNRDDALVLGIFGTVYSIPGIEQLIAVVRSWADSKKKKFTMLVVGKSRNSIIDEIEIKMGSEQVIRTGFLDAKDLDDVLREADAGLCSTFCDGIDKSAAAAAWLERGIPVIVSPKDQTYESDMKSRGIFQINGEADFDTLWSVRGNLPRFSRLSEVAKTYQKAFLR